MTFKPWVGMTIEECAELTCKVSNMCRCPVDFEFNGIECQSHAGLRPADVVSRYQAKSVDRQRAVIFKEPV